MPYLIKNVSYIWRYVKILLGTVIESAKVNDEPLSTVFLLNKNNCFDDVLCQMHDFGPFWVDCQDICIFN